MKRYFTNLFNYLIKERLLIILLSFSFVLFGGIWLTWFWKNQLDIFPYIFISVIFVINIILAFFVWSRENFATYLLIGITIFIQCMFAVYFFRYLYFQ